MSVDELREEMVKLGIPREKADEIKGKGNVVSELQKLMEETNFSSEELDLDVNNIDKADIDEALEEMDVQIPLRTDEGWHDFVMSKFNEDELVEDPRTKKKCPTVDGLRRIVELLIGEIIHSAPVSYNNKYPSSTDRFATICYSVKIQSYNSLGPIEFGGVADANPFNTEGDYQKHLSSIAETRAEARALRKALGLKKTVAAEEVISPESPSDFKPSEEKIQDMQITLIDKMCKENDIDVIKFVNSGSLKYNNIKDMLRETASQAVGYLNEYAREAIKIPDSIKGYDPDWRKV